MTLEAVTFVVPTYCTADELPQLIDQIDTAAPAFARRHTVIVIDDGCPERSGDTVAGRASVVVHRFETNRGQRAAVLTGLSHADSSVVCTMDADLQDDPVSVGELVTALRDSGADVVCAGRRGSHESVMRRGQAWMFRRLRWTISRGRIPPDAGLFHVATAAAVHRMLAVASPRDDPIVAYARSGATIVSVPVERRPRPTGRSSYTTARRLSTAAGSLRGASTIGRRPRRPHSPAYRSEDP